MATIKRYTQGIVRQRPVANIVDTQALQRAGGAARALGGLSGLGADLINKHIQANETTAVNNAVIQKKKQTLDARISGQQERSNNPFGWAKDFNESITKADEELLKSLPSEAARQAAKDTFANINLQNYEKSLIWENNQATKIYAERTEEAARTLNDLSYQAGVDGGTLDDILRDIDATTASVATYQNDRFVLEQSNKTMTRNAVRSYIQGQMSQAVTVEDAKALQEQYGSDQIRDLIGNKEADEFVESAKELEKAIVDDMFKNTTISKYNQFLNQEQVSQEIVLNEGLSAVEKKLQLDRMVFDGTISNEYASRAKRLISSQEEAEKPDIDLGVKIQVYDRIASDVTDFVENEKKFTNESVNFLNQIEMSIGQAIESGELEKSDARLLSKTLNSHVRELVEKNKSGGASLAPGIQDPYGKGLQSIENAAKSDPDILDSLGAKKEIFQIYTDIIGRVDKDGNISEKAGEYKSSGSHAFDKQRINIALEKAIDIYKSDQAPSVRNLGENRPRAVLNKNGDIVTFKEKGGLSSDETISASDSIRDVYELNNGAKITREEIERKALAEGLKPIDIVNVLKAQGLIK